MRAQLLMLFLVFSTSVRAQSLDFAIEVHTQLKQMVLGLQDETKAGELSEFRLNSLLRAETLKILAKARWGVPADPTLEKRLEDIAAKVLNAIEWKPFTNKIIAESSRIQNMTARSGMIAGAIFGLHVVVNWIMPFVFNAAGHPEWAVAFLAYPFLAQGTMLGMIVQRAVDESRLKEIYGAELLSSLRTLNTSVRHQLSLAGIKDVLVPLQLKFGEVVLAIEGRTWMGRLRNFLDPKRQVIHWGGLKKEFSGLGDLTAFIKVLDDEASLNAESKAAVLLHHMSHEFPVELEKYLRRFGRLKNPTDLFSTSFFTAMEAWALSFEGVETSSEMRRLSLRAPLNVPDQFRWRVWMKIALPEFLKNNIALNVIERRAWVLAGEEFLAKSERSDLPTGDFAAEFDDLMKLIEIRHAELAGRPLPRVARACFAPLQKWRLVRALDQFTPPPLPPF